MALIGWLRGLFGKTQREREIDAELESYVALLAAEKEKS